TARDSLGAAPGDARIISRGVVSNTPFFPKKLPIVLIATLAPLFVTAGFITTGELLAGNVYRGGVPVEPIAEPAAAPSEPPAAKRSRRPTSPNRANALAPAPSERQVAAPQVAAPSSELTIADIAQALRGA